MCLCHCGTNQWNGHGIATDFCHLRRRGIGLVKTGTDVRANRVIKAGLGQPQFLHFCSHGLGTGLFGPENTYGKRIRGIRCRRQQAHVQEIFKLELHAGGNPQIVGSVGSSVDNIIFRFYFGIHISLFHAHNGCHQLCRAGGINHFILVLSEKNFAGAGIHNRIGMTLHFRCLDLSFSLQRDSDT